MSEFIRNLNGAGWAPINRKSMDDVRLSISARGVLGWLCSRPDDHKIVLPYLMRQCGISQPTWRRIRKELESAGYLVVTKAKKEGRFTWRYELCDTPSN